MAAHGGKLPRREPREGEDLLVSRFINQIKNERATSSAVIMKKIIRPVFKKIDPKPPRKR
jgi:hypothetical protein